MRIIQIYFTNSRQLTETQIERSMRCNFESEMLKALDAHHLSLLFQTELRQSYTSCTTLNKVLKVTLEIFIIAIYLANGL